MKKQRKLDHLPFGVFLLSGIGFFLRSALYDRALDEKNLLLRLTPLEIALWACTAAVVVLVLLVTVKQTRSSEKFENAFAPSLPAAIGHIMAASGLLLTVLLSELAYLSVLGKVWRLVGLMSAPLLLWAAFDRLRGKRPFFGVYAVCSVFFALHLINHYQSWCADPQLQNYVFAFAGIMALMLFSYHQCAFCVSLGNCSVLRITGLLAAYFCLVAAANTRQLYLFLGCAVWAITSLCLPGEKEGAKDGTS